MGGGKLVSAVLVVVCVNFVLLVCGGKRVFGRVGCPFVVMCCSKVFLKIPFLNLNGYSDLSVEERIVEGRAIMGGWRFV